jgi:hypothetical protein
MPTEAPLSDHAERADRGRYLDELLDGEGVAAEIADVGVGRAQRLGRGGWVTRSAAALQLPL